MKSSKPSRLVSLLPTFCLLVVAGQAAANTIAQNVSWTIDRPDTETKYRVVAYGDSIFAGYKGSVSRVAIWSAPNIQGEYASTLWNSDIEVIRRTKSGARAADVYQSKIVEDASWMQTPETRIVAIDLCGNDALEARANFASQDGVCNYEHLDIALDACTEWQEKAMIFINANASPSVTMKVITNLYYPGYDADNQPAGCTDEVSGLAPNRQDVFLPYLLRMNWRACHFAAQYGFQCADAFADFMGSDYDTNADNRKDSRMLKYRKGESEDAYVTRIGTTLRSTIRDADAHFISATKSFDYIQSDNTHPTYKGGTEYLGAFGGSASGTSEPRFVSTQYRHGKNPIWRKFGHERMGRALTLGTPLLP